MPLSNSMHSTLKSLPRFHYLWPVQIVPTRRVDSQSKIGRQSTFMISLITLSAPEVISSFHSGCVFCLEADHG